MPPILSAMIVDALMKDFKFPSSNMSFSPDVRRRWIKLVDSIIKAEVPGA